MWDDRSPTIRASRVAIAGSIYMRRASVQMFNPKQQTVIKNENIIRNPSSGKIVKNGTKKYDTNNICLGQLSSMPNRMISPMLDKKNLLHSAIQQNYTRKTPTPSFGHFDDYENSKIKSIQQKYKTMLSDYETKKKSIHSQLSSLRASSTQLQKAERYSSAYKQNRQETALSQRAAKEGLYKQYQKQSKEMIIQKINANQTNLKLNKKQKITDIYPNFFKSLKNQIMLEEELKNIKKAIPPDMKSEIEKILSQNENVIDKKLADIDQQQYDPFETLKICSLSAQAQVAKLIKKYEQCQTNWRQGVCNLNKKQAQQIFYALNFEKTEQITLKSLVRELSFLLEKHLRNRDLLKIYKRISPLTELNFCRKTALKQ